MNGEEAACCSYAGGAPGDAAGCSWLCCLRRENSSLRSAIFRVSAQARAAEYMKAFSGQDGVRFGGAERVEWLAIRLVVVGVVEKVATQFRD